MILKVVGALICGKADDSFTIIVDINVNYDNVAMKISKKCVAYLTSF